MEDTIEIHGTLKEAVIVAYGRGNIAYGNIYDDAKGRFADGVRVHTSRILEGPDDNGIIKTQNSVYKLEMSGKGLGSEASDA